MNSNREESAENKKFTDALLANDGRMPSSSAEGREAAKKVLRRDQRRVRILTWATSGFFLLMILGLGLSIYWYYMKVLPTIVRFDKDINITAKKLHDQEPLPESELSKKEPLGGFVVMTARFCQILYEILFVTILGIAVLFVVMLASAFCTLLLIMASHRAALGQIQASLLVLSEHFQALQGSSPGRHSIGET
jgi:hypothetical protein